MYERVMEWLGHVQGCDILLHIRIYVKKELLILLSLHRLALVAERRRCGMRDFAARSDRVCVSLSRV